MTGDDEDDRECAVISAESERVLDRFQSWTLGKDLFAATATRHWGNVQFCVNEFLLHDEPRRAGEGVESGGLVSRRLVCQQGGLGEGDEQDVDGGEPEGVL